MSSIDEILAQMKRNATGVRFGDLCRVCDRYFGKHRRGGTSHRVYKTPWQGDPRVNIHISSQVTYSSQSRREAKGCLFFYPAVKCGQIKGNLSASSRGLHKAFTSLSRLSTEKRDKRGETEAFALAASHRQSKKKLPLCGLCASAVSKRFRNPIHENTTYWPELIR